MDCWHNSAGACECQQKKVSVIVDDMGCSGGWKTTAATEHSTYIAGYITYFLYHRCKEATNRIISQQQQQQNQQED
jgi:hypothetical protein